MGPVSVNIDINNTCNLGCEYCRVEKGDSQLDFDRFKSIVDGHQETDYFGVGGGEPMLHPQVVDMLGYLFAKGKTVNLATNLTQNVCLLDPALEPFSDSGIDQFTLQVNLPASNAELYEKVTRTRNFDEVVENIRKVSDDFITLVSEVVYRGNLSFLCKG